MQRVSFRSVARRTLLAICLAAAAVAGEDRPAGGYQILKHGALGAQGQKPEGARPARTSVAPHDPARGGGSRPEHAGGQGRAAASL